tara:strand:+ start:919 stop:1140 length:222 start_codon:yes stop_codon:yes gene_type:complete
MKNIFNILFSKKVLAFMFIIFLIGSATLHFPYGDGGWWFSIAAIVLLVIVFGGVWYYEKLKGRDYFEDFKKKK